MSWHYLQGLEAASWEGTCLDGAPDALSSLMPIPGPCCSPDSVTDAFRDSQSGTTCGHSMAGHGMAALTSSPEDSHARTSAQQEKAPASPEPDPVSGHTWRESSARYDRNSHGWKTHQCLWEEALPWSSVTLPKWGMMRDGVLWERTMPGLLISVSGSGFWPTPCLPGKGGTNGKKKLKEMLSWPTPTAMDSSQTLIETEEQWIERNKRKKSENPNLGQIQKSLRSVVHWPTPTACMQKGSSQAALTRKDGQSRENDRLDHSVMASDGGQLNPTWVEWLMGWPLLWTSTEPMPLETWPAWESAFQSEPTGCAVSATVRCQQHLSLHGES